MGRSAKNMSAHRTGPRRTTWSRIGRARRYLNIGAAVALGLLFAAPEASALSLLEGDFEGLALGSGSLPNGLPGAVGSWEGDESSIVEAENGITPVSGSQMLRFVGTATTGASNTGAAQMFQLVDTTGTATGTLLQASMFVNRVAGDSQTDNRFTLQILAYSGATGGFSTVFQKSELGMSTGGNFFSDADPSTWELVQTDPFALPVGTTYVALHMFASENVFDDNTLPEFDGHYVDLVRLVPEPGTSVLAAAGLALLAGARARRSKPRLRVGSPTIAGLM